MCVHLVGMLGMEAAAGGTVIFIIETLKLADEDYTLVAANYLQTIPLLSLK